MKNILRLGLASILSLCAGIVLAAPYFTITKSSNVSFPAEILVGTEGLGDYIVTNVSGSAQSVHVQNLPAGFSVVSATGLSPASCDSSSLANNASCTLRLSYVSNMPISSTQFTIPTVCPTSQYVIGCIYPITATDFSVGETPTSDMTTLSAPAGLLLTPGQTTEIEVTNTGSTTANNVQITLPAELNQYLESGAVTSCASVAPSASCLLSLAMASNLPVNTPTMTASIGASNAPSINLMVEIGSGEVFATDVMFTTPDTQSITLTNEGAVAITGLSLELGSDVHNVSETGGTCGSGTLAPNASCTYTLLAESNAYGSDTATLRYTQGTEEKTTTSNITVVNTSISINGGQDIEGSTDPSSGSFTIENTGEFSWQSPAVIRSDNDDWLTLDTSDCTGAALAPGASCDIDYTLTGLHDLSSVITASGSNASVVSQNFIPDEYISVGVEGDSSYQHLGYRAVRVTNLTQSPQTLSAMTATPPSALSSQITLCDSSGSNCAAVSYAQSDCQNGTVLAPSARCHLWYQANSATALGTTAASINVSMTATPSGGSANSLSRSINFTYDNSLYVGGNFTSPATSIAKWNGTDWSALNSGANLFVASLAVFNGDLYAGGYFNTAGGNSANHVAQWNGSAWSALGDGVSNPINALAVFNNTLYAGGTFTSAGGLSANNIAQWNGSEWSALGDGVVGSVYSLFALGSNLYVGGTFTSAGGLSANNIARWSGTAWSTSVFGDGVSDNLVPQVRAFTSLNNTLYVGGFFTSAGGTPANRIAQFDSTTNTWSSLANGLGGPTGPNAVDALVILNGTLYAGGGFLDTGGTPGTRVNNIAQWNGSSWSPVSGGGTNSVISALIAFNGGLYASGIFTQAGGTDATRIAQWNGTNWSALGTGINNNTTTLVVIPSLSLS